MHRNLCELYPFTPSSVQGGRCSPVMGLCWVTSACTLGLFHKCGSVVTVAVKGREMTPHCFVFARPCVSDSWDWLISADLVQEDFFYKQSHYFVILTTLKNPAEL